METPPPHDWHAPIIAAIVKAYGSQPDIPRYLEIGVDRGDTLAYVNEYGGLMLQAYGVDITMDNITHRNRRMIYPDARLFQCSSDEFFNMWNNEHKDTPFDVIFIDGDHHAEQVWKDLHNALKIIKPTGTIILHDTYPIEGRWMYYCEDAYKTVEAFMRGQPHMQVFTLPLFPGLTLITHEYRPRLDK